MRITEQLVLRDTKFWAASRFINWPKLWIVQYIHYIIILCRIIMHTYIVIILYIILCILYIYILWPYMIMMMMMMMDDDDDD